LKGLGYTAKPSRQGILSTMGVGGKTLFPSDCSCFRNDTNLRGKKNLNKIQNFQKKNVCTVGQQ
jgi:hypothetical protein